MSSIDIKDLQLKYQEANKVRELKQFSEQLTKIVDKLQQENAFLKEKLNQLESFAKNGPSLGIQKVATEELICMEQIEILRNKSHGRELTLDEVKRLDLLVKNLRLSREQATQVVDTMDYQSVTEDDLVAIASQSEDR